MPSEPLELIGRFGDEALAGIEPPLTPPGERIVPFVAGRGMNEANEIDPTMQRAQRATVRVLVVHQLVHHDIPDAPNRVERQGADRSETNGTCFSQCRKLLEGLVGMGSDCTQSARRRSAPDALRLAQRESVAVFLELVELGEKGR